MCICYIYIWFVRSCFPADILILWYILRTVFTQKTWHVLRFILFQSNYGLSAQFHQSDKDWQTGRCLHWDVHWQQWIWNSFCVIIGQPPSSSIPYDNTKCIIMLWRRRIGFTSSSHNVQYWPCSEGKDWLWAVSKNGKSTRCYGWWYLLSHQLNSACHKFTSGVRYKQCRWSITLTHIFCYRFVKNSEAR